MEPPGRGAEGLVLLTHILPGGQGLGPTAKDPKRHLWGEPLALGVAQGLLGALKGALGATLWGALGDPVAAHFGVPLGTGALLLVSGALLVALAKGPSVGRARAGLALGAVAAVASLLELVLGGLLLPHGCGPCARLGPTAQGVVLGSHALLLTSSAAGAGLAVTGAVAAGRGGTGSGRTPIVIYQTALPGAGGGAGPGEAPPPHE